jgi:hypothetical protein
LIGSGVIYQGLIKVMQIIINNRASQFVFAFYQAKKSQIAIFGMINPKPAVLNKWLD